MNNLRVQYIKCFDRTNLIKYLRDENFTVEAEILKPRDIDGMRFLELTELDLVQWRLTPKQKQLILNCRDKILGESTTQLKMQKPPVLKKPSHAILARTNKFDASFSQELQTRLQLNKNLKQSQQSSPNKTVVQNQERGEAHNTYIDMTQKTNKQSPNVSKSMANNKHQTQPKFQTPKPNLPPRNKPSSASPKLCKPNINNHNSAKSARPLPKPPANLLEDNEHNKINPVVLPEKRDPYQTSGDEDYLDPEPSNRPLPPPPLEQFSSTSQLGRSRGDENFQALSDRKGRCPAVPLPPKVATIETAEEDIYEEEPLDPIYEADPLVPSHAGPVMPIQRYDNHRLKSTPLDWGRPGVRVPEAEPKGPSLSETCKIEGQIIRDRPSWKNGRRLPLPRPDNSNEPSGRIWNTSDASGLPKPPAFENKFEQAQLSLIKLLNAETLDTSNEEFNPNNCPYYRSTDRKGAKQLLERIPNLADGAFLFRKSDEYFLAITMYYQKRFYNVGLHRNCEGRFYCKTDNEKRVMTFKTLQDFIEYYKTHPLTLKMQGSDVKIFLRELLPPHIY